MATALTSTQGAALIREVTGRPCSRQNLEQHCQKRRLPKSLLSPSPIRLNAETLVDEYLANVALQPPAPASQKPKHKALRPAATAKFEPPQATRLTNLGDEDLPDYNVSRARTEFEKANLLELDRKTKEGLLLPRDQVERVWGNAVTIARTRLLGVPTRTRQRIPHLSLEEVAILEELIREALEELAEGGPDGE
jgi:hypothetical protein